MKRHLSALPYAGAGVLATLAGMSAGHLVAAAQNPATSPVLAVGSAVIDLTPTPVKELAVRELGTRDKPVLIGSVVLVTLVVSVIAGLLARRRPALGAGILVALVAVAGALALLRPFAVASDVLPAVVAAVVGVGVLAFLVRLLRASASPRRPGGFETLAGARSSTTGAGAHSGPVVEEGEERARLEATDDPEPKPRLLLSGTSATRRTVLVSAAFVALVSGGIGWLGQRLAAIRIRPEDVDLPAAADPLGPLPRGLEQRYGGISRFQTRNGDFYRVDVNLSVPVVDLDGWRLEIDGDVDEELSLTFDDLLAMDLVERDITLTCVSNEVGGPYVGAARWLGVPLTTLLDRAGVGSTADQIYSTAVDGFTISTPLAVALDGRDSMVAVGMNGEALPAEHGFPARLVTPGLYGFVGATKWLRRLTLTTYEEQSAYWTDRDWATEAPIKVSSRIDTPQAFTTVGKENAVIGGVAWAQTRGIGKVEVRVDGGPWREATLGPDAGVAYWRQWFLAWKDATPGRHRVACRATTLEGDVQTAARATPFPAGSSGIQEIAVDVA
ncbi:oxidoreductase [Nocardioides guangzhouensis]|uniref:Oxidoreductase n=1 Tax=Nocardioides guangzhouensis TaxID=2497878 RepID=A0A4Q4ZI33_9ACTN|nr:molybdopterin-dependent oxidoreductase [Nocardioides guangzhouensis]RYP87191.1 oxidoreductase [Nocardioides guangzhouensis]